MSADDLDGTHQPDRPRLPDQRMIVEPSGKFLGKVGPGILFDAIDQAFVADDLQVLQGDGAADGVAGIGIAVIELAALFDQGRGDPVTDQKCRKRLVA